jgi:hypothetical protein
MLSTLHFVIGHGANWRKWNSNLDETAMAMHEAWKKAKIRSGKRP